MTMLEAIKAVREAVTQMDIMRESPNAHWSVEDVEDIVGDVWEKIEAAESEAKLEAEAFERAREAFSLLTHETPSIKDHISWPVLSRFYFAAGEKGE